MQISFSGARPTVASRPRMGWCTTSLPSRDTRRQGVASGRFVKLIRYEASVRELSKSCPSRVQSVSQRALKRNVCRRRYRGSTRAVIAAYLQSFRRPSGCFRPFLKYVVEISNKLGKLTVDISAPCHLRIDPYRPMGCVTTQSPSTATNSWSLESLRSAKNRSHGGTRLVTTGASEGPYSVTRPL